MIEIVYKDENQPTEDKTVEKLPKNIRQIGEPDNRLRVYMEDFAATYLQKTGKYRPDQIKICVLYGEEKEKEGQPILFIQSAARLQICEMQGENANFDPDWKVAEGIRKKFFPQQDVLGWAVISAAQDPMLLEQIKTVHRHHFTGRYQILFWSDGSDREEIFFNAGAGELMSLNGYYVYYEENLPMREYMISHNPLDTDRVGEPQDQAVKEFRQAVARKKMAKVSAAGQLVRVAAAACVVLAIAGVLRYAGNVKSGSAVKNAAAIVKEQWKESSETAVEEQKTETTAQMASGIKTSAVNLTDPEDGKNEASTASDVVVSTSGEIKDEENTQRQAVSSATEQTEKDAQTSADAASSADLNKEDKESVDSAASETSAEGYRAYQVKSGDTISSISQAYYGNMRMVDEICSLNHIKEQDLIYTGQILLLP